MWNRGAITVLGIGVAFLIFGFVMSLISSDRVVGPVSIGVVCGCFANLLSRYQKMPRSRRCIRAIFKEDPPKRGAEAE